MWHHETPLHWAASNDDVDLIDGLVDAGADIEHPGSSISGGPPAESAVGYAQWKALRRLYQLGATMNLSRAAALGLMPLVTGLVTAAHRRAARSFPSRSGTPAAPASSKQLATWRDAARTSTGAPPGPARRRPSRPRVRGRRVAHRIRRRLRVSQPGS